MVGGSHLLNTAVTRLLGIEYPILQGGMAWVAQAELAAAVSEAGGLGIIGAGNMPAAALREEIERARQLTKKPFGVNVMLMSPPCGTSAAIGQRAASPCRDHRCR
jgi:enoyl-[acyl-carrier protein] reductase II